MVLTLNSAIKNFQRISILNEVEFPNFFLDYSDIRGEYENFALEKFNNLFYNLSFFTGLSRFIFYILVYVLHTLCILCHEIH